MNIVTKTALFISIFASVTITAIVVDARSDLTINRLRNEIYAQKAEIDNLDYQLKSCKILHKKE